MPPMKKIVALLLSIITATSSASNYNTRTYIAPSKYEKTIKNCTLGLPQNSRKIIIDYLKPWQGLGILQRSKKIQPLHNAVSQFCTLSHNNQYLALSIKTRGNLRQGVAIYDFETLSNTIILQKDLHSLEISFSDDSYLALGDLGDSHTINIWKPDTCDPWTLINKFEVNSNSADHIKFIPKSHNLMLLQGNGVNIVDIYSKKTLDRFEEEDEKEGKASAAAVSSCGELMALAINKKIVLMHMRNKTKTIIPFPSEYMGHKMEMEIEITSLKFSPTNKFLIWEQVTDTGDTIYSILYNIKDNAVVFFIARLSQVHLIQEDQELLAIERPAYGFGNTIVQGKIKETSKNGHEIPFTQFFYKKDIITRAIAVSQSGEIVVALANKVSKEQLPGIIYTFERKPQT